VISPASLGAFQANFFDGKSDGKNLFSILLLRFTVRRGGIRREGLEIKAFSQLGIAGLGKSLHYCAAFRPCRDLTSCKPRSHPLRVERYLWTINVLGRFDCGLRRMAGSEQAIRQLPHSGRSAR
jgi:hypothetical protein